MKLKYEKPILYSESFEVEDMICSSCGTKAIYEADSCPVDVPGIGTIFTDATGGCEFTLKIDICYHIATPGNNIFSSGA